jgi:hypothetical protein
VTRRSHKAVEVAISSHYTVLIDEKVAQLVEDLNRLGLFTHMSCENNVHGRTWISFIDSTHAKFFMNLVAANASAALRRKIMNSTTEEYDRNPDGWKIRGRWWVDAYVQCIDEKAHVRISIRFPRAHLPEVEEIVHRVATTCFVDGKKGK